MKIYIAGSITNYDGDYVARFHLAATKLADMGHEVINPVVLPHQHDKKWHSYMKESIKAMMDCDTIYMLKGWEQSQGAKIENWLANHLNYNIICE